MTVLIPLTTLEEGQRVTVRLPIFTDNTLQTLANDVAVLSEVKASSTRLTFPRNGFTISADNALLLDNVEQFVHEVAPVARPAYACVTADDDEKIHIIVDSDGVEIARATSAESGQHIAETLCAAAVSSEDEADAETDFGGAPRI